jgi:hypothetical protein
MLDDSELFSGAKRRREFDMDEEVDAELSSDEEIEEPNMIGSDSEWSCVGSETYTVVYTRSCTIQFIIGLLGLLLWVCTKSADKVNKHR